MSKVNFFIVGTPKSGTTALYTYLSSDTAPQAIQSYNPQAKIIIMLRNPIDSFISEHSKLLYSFYENIARKLTTRNSVKNTSHRLSQDKFYVILSKLSDGIDLLSSLTGRELSLGKTNTP